MYQAWLDDWDIVICEESYNYFMELIKFRESYPDQWNEFQKKRKKVKQ